MKVAYIFATNMAATFKLATMILPQLAIKRMSAAASLDVPLLVEAGVGDNWDQAH